VKNPILKLDAWKERLFFLLVLLLAALMLAKAPLFGSGVEEVYSELREGAIKASGMSVQEAAEVERKLTEPDPVVAIRPDPRDINGIMFDDRDRFTAEGGSSFVRGQESFEHLPPLSLALPGYSPLNDYDLIPGPRPNMDKIGAQVPRDRRAVKLTNRGEGEFD